MSQNNIDNFEKIELECMKVLTSKCDTYISQYDIYNFVYEKFDIKDPSDKERFKYKFLIVLRGLCNSYSDVIITNKDDVLYLCFSTQNDKNNVEFKQNIQKPINEAKNPNLPTDISVIHFILDQDLPDFYSQKDYLGNNLLHYLIMYNDIDRIQKHYTILKDMIYDKNNDDKSPLELIKDLKISNFFISLLIKNNRNLSHNLDDLTEQFNDFQSVVHKNIIITRVLILLIFVTFYITQFY